MKIDRMESRAARRAECIGLVLQETHEGPIRHSSGRFEADDWQNKPTHNRADRKVVLASCERGNVIWVVWHREQFAHGELIEDAIWIESVLVWWDPRDNRWKSQTIEENAPGGPPYDTCPLSYFELTREGVDSTNDAWRLECANVSRDRARKVRLRRAARAHQQQMEFAVA